jgi:beta-lactam-binding protein with PASTA domain
MSIAKRGASALGKLLTVAVLAASFAAGLVGVVYMSLRGDEMKVPEIVGKDLIQSEKELADLGLRIKKRADRYSNEKPNTILEQLPRAGETVKTGQMILVVTSKTNPDAADEAPATIKKSGTDEDDTEKIEELISDKPKKQLEKSETQGV